MMMSRAVTDRRAEAATMDWASLVNILGQAENMVLLGVPTNAEGSTQRPGELARDQSMVGFQYEAGRDGGERDAGYQETKVDQHPAGTERNLVATPGGFDGSGAQSA